MTLNECKAKYPLTSFVPNLIFDRVDCRYWSPNDFITISEDYDVAFIDENDEMWTGIFETEYVQGYFTQSGDEFFPIFLIDGIFEWGEYDVYYDENIDLKKLTEETFGKKIKTFNIKEWYEEKVKNEI